MCAGALLAIDPPLFVRIMRRAAFGDSYIKTAEWEKSVVWARRKNGRMRIFLFWFGRLLRSVANDPRHIAV